MAVIIQLRHDTASNWTTNNPILAVGEAGIETDTNRIKVGNGVARWNSLAYFGGAVQSVNGKTGEVILDAADVGALPDSTVIPTVNNGTLTIQVNGTDVQTFSANQSSNVTANIEVPDSATWGNITGTLSDQTDLQNALNAKQDDLTAGTGIDITSNTISNSGVRSISTGATNGTISVNTNGTSAEVSVYGLGTAAYTSSTDYATSAQGTKADSAVQDVQVNGTSVVTSGVANVTVPTRTSVTDTTSTSITLANAVAGTDYHYGTLTSLTITANDTSDIETTIYFTAGNTINVSLPTTIDYIGSAPVFEPNTTYAISILNNILIAGAVA